jgi:hypothetical protein
MIPSVLFDMHIMRANMDNTMRTVFNTPVTSRPKAAVSRIAIRRSQDVCGRIGQQLQQQSQQQCCQQQWPAQG